ncbi:MAG TPA: hypothetical protein DCE23_04435 [Firmicutes bacterium]|nr:hypothetical protein [Bacillota bacterium]
MALKIYNKIVKENIEDKDGNVIGTIQFDPNDERIMKTLSDIIRNLTEKINKQKEVGDVNVNKLQQSLKNQDQFDDSIEDLLKVNQLIDLQYDAIKETIDSFAEVFGKETMDVITGGSVSLNNLKPLINFISPYVKNARKALTDKYLSKNSNVL